MGSIPTSGVEATCIRNRFSLMVKREDIGIGVKIKLVIRDFWIILLILKR
jgi:hypothetical protein